MKVNLEKLVEDLQEALNHFNTQIKNTLPGQSGILESIMVEAYGNKMKLREIALINFINNYEIEIKPYDKQLTKDIERAVNAKNIGTLCLTGSSLIFRFPPLTLSFYERLTKLMKEQLENFNLRIKMIRRDHLDSVKHLQQTNKERYKKEQENVEKLMEKFKKEAETFFEKTTSKLKT